MIGGPVMPTRSCPRCRVPGRRQLTVLSELSGSVNYYRCDLCGHVWTVIKDETRLVSTVTISHEPHDPEPS
jgi:uncharacterized Zn finger protein